MCITKLTVAALAAVALMAQTRFDYLVRNDMFAGFAGDRAALKGGMDTTERVLAENPNHAEALVWHGGGMFFLAGAEFSQGNVEKGSALLQNGLAEMSQAGQLEPDNIGVIIPRGAILMTATRQMDDNPMRAALIEKARADFQHTFDLQQNRLDKMGTHPLGELLQGLGDLYSRQGQPGEARKYYQLTLDKLKDTEYARRAAQWLETGQTLPANKTGCVGCHTGGGSK